MMKHRFFMLSVGFLVAVAGMASHAEENPFKNISGDKEESGLAVKQEAPRAKPKPENMGPKVNGKICRRAVTHVPRDDVAYQAGVDAYGNPVTPADLPGSNFDLDIPDEVSFDLSFNPLKYAGNSNLEDTFSDASMSMGTIKYSISSGRLTYNGKPMNDDQHAAIAAACREYAKKNKY